MTPFRRAGPSRTAITIQVDGEPVPAVAGESVASALMASGRTSFGVSGKTGNGTTPYCLIGICFGCLCEVDGRKQVQACLTPVRDGMTVRTAASKGERPNDA